MIDLRSDTATTPTPAMRRAMAAAEVGNDGFGEDPTVNRLQQLSAETVGKEAALFVPSGTQANLAGILSHCERGDEFIIGQQGHSYLNEGGGAAVLGSVQPQPLDFEADGTLDLNRVESAIKPLEPLYVRTRLLCLENTKDGLALPLTYLQAAAELTQRHGLALHLDGARVFNAAVKLGVPVTDITRHADTVSFCLSKGLGAPVGSMLCGGRELIGKGLRWRQVLGGGMRQAGIIAAAGIYALEHNIERLAADHANAAALAEGLSGVAGLKVDYAPSQTNMVFISMPDHDPYELTTFLELREIRTIPGRPMRLVTHLGVSSDDVETSVAAIREFFTQ